MDMLALTGRDLEWIARLQNGWQRYYLAELSRLLMEGHGHADARGTPLLVWTAPKTATVATIDLRKHP